MFTCMKIKWCYHIRISCIHLLVSNGLSLTASFRAFGSLENTRIHGRLSRLEPSPKFSNAAAVCCDLISSCIKVKSITVLRSFQSVLAFWSLSSVWQYTLFFLLYLAFSKTSAPMRRNKRVNSIPAGTRRGCTRNAFSKLMWAHALLFWSPHFVAPLIHRQSPVDIGSTLSLAYKMTLRLSCCYVLDFSSSHPVYSFEEIKARSRSPRFVTS